MNDTSFGWTMLIVDGSIALLLLSLVVLLAVNVFRAFGYWHFSWTPLISIDVAVGIVLVGFVVYMFSLMDIG
jgi:hypothetical protein